MKTNWVVNAIEMIKINSVYDLICYYNFENKYYMFKHNFLPLISKLICSMKTNRVKIEW